MRPSEPGAPERAGGPSGTAVPFTVEPIDAAELVRLHFFVPRHAVSYTRFILEGYDHLGVQTSAPGSSHVTWTVPAALRADAEQLLSELLNKLR